VSAYKVVPPKEIRGDQCLMSLSNNPNSWFPDHEVTDREDKVRLWLSVKQYANFGDEPANTDTESTAKNTGGKKKNRKRAKREIRKRVAKQMFVRGEHVVLVVAPDSK